MSRAPTCRARDRGIAGLAPIYIPPWCVSMLRIPNSLEGFDVFLGCTRFLGFTFSDSIKAGIGGDTRARVGQMSLLGGFYPRTAPVPACAIA